MSARPGPSGGYHASGIPTGIANREITAEQHSDPDKCGPAG